MFRIQVDKTQQTIIEKEITTSGSANVYDIEYTFSPDWDGFQKTAVFIGVSIATDNEEIFTDPYSIALDDTNRCKIPWELMLNVGDKIRTGVFGMKGLTSILPTNIVEITTISQGIYNGEVIPSDPTPTAYQDILKRINDVYDAIAAGMIKGDRGERGYKGEKGDRGERGYKGDRGPMGPPGLATELAANYGFSSSLNLNIAVPDSLIFPTSKILPIQEGSGAPSPTNIRQIVGWDELVLNQNGTNFSQILDDVAYEGSFDWANGILTITHKMFNLPISEMEVGDNHEDFPGWISHEFHDCIPIGINTWLSDFICNVGTSVSANSMHETFDGTRLWLPKSTYHLTRTEWNEQYPDLVVQILLPLIDPIVMNLSPQDIFASNGDNIISSNCGPTSAICQVYMKDYIDLEIARRINELTR